MHPDDQAFARELIRYVVLGLVLIAILYAALRWSEPRVVTVPKATATVTVTAQPPTPTPTPTPTAKK